SGALQFATVGTCYGSSDTRDTTAFNNFKKKLEGQGGSIIVPKDTVLFSLGEARVTVTHVTTDLDDPNEDELIVRIVYGETSFLFTGDIGADTERAYIESGIEVESTVLKVPHHGSNTSSSYLFLREVNPSIAVISVGRNNDYGHPTKEVLSRYRDLGCELYRTDFHGDVTITSDGIHLEVITEKTPLRDVYTPGRTPT
ncbi:MAG: hypothetical protein FWG24_07005, partial [Eggerthellaceae bacterium]|nr:hypothetical protein [Eggerthellaceae bacterium]